MALDERTTESYGFIDPFFDGVRTDLDLVDLTARGAARPDASSRENWARSWLALTDEPDWG